MNEGKPRSSCLEWTKLIVCGLVLGILLAHSLFCIRCWLLGFEIPFPVFVFLPLLFHVAELVPLWGDRSPIPFAGVCFDRHLSPNGAVL